LLRFGLNIPLPGLSLARHREILDELPRLGYTDLWTGEAAGADAFSPLVMAAAWASPLRLGIGVVPVHTRGPALLAQTAAALAELAMGEVVLGVGSSGPRFVTAANGIPFSQPYQRVRDTVRFLRTVYRQGWVSGEFDTFAIEGFRLGRPPERPPRVLVGALRPGMLRLGFGEADGAMTNFLTAEDVRTVVDAVGPARGDGELVARIFVCPTEDTEYARALGRRMLAGILTAPTYRAFHDWLGRGEELALTQKLAIAGEHFAAARAIPDDLVDAILVHGSPERCAEQIQAYVDAGVDTPVLMLQPTPESSADPGALRDVIRALAPVS
jgi:probable F420-dependent oxidoreductase